MDKSLQRFFVITIMFVLLPGCATILRDTKQDIEIVTDPAGATATAAGYQITTPGFLKLSRQSDSENVQISKEGYKSQLVTVRRQMSFWMLPILFYGESVVTGITLALLAPIHLGYSGVIAVALGTFGTAVYTDFHSGAGHVLLPEKIEARLSPDGP